MNLTEFLNRRRARRAYFQAQKFAAKCSTDLYTTIDPVARALLLEQFADAEQAMAHVHRDAFGPDPIEDEGGRDLADATASSAVLMRMLAATERAALDPSEGSRYVFWCLADYAESAELDLWAELARTRDRSARARLIEQIWPHAARRVGSQAAESLACHAHTEQTLADAQTTGRAPRPPKAMSSWWAVTTVLLIVAGAALLARDLFPAGWMR